MPAVATDAAVTTHRTTIHADLLRFMDWTANEYAANACDGISFAELNEARIPPSIVARQEDFDLVAWAAELGHSEGAFVRAVRNEARR